MGVTAGLVDLKGDRRTAAYKAWRPWLEAAARLVKRFDDELDDDPFAYNETASVSLLASAAAQVGYLGLAEFGVTKGHRHNRRLTVDGRCDFWMAGETTTWGFEFKQRSPTDRLTPSIPLRGMEEAMEAARCLRHDEADERVGGLIVPLYWIEDEADLVDACAALTAFAKHCEFAWRIPAPGDSSGDTFLFFSVVAGRTRWKPQ